MFNDIIDVDGFATRLIDEFGWAFNHEGVCLAALLSVACLGCNPAHNAVKPTDINRKTLGLLVARDDDYREHSWWNQLGPLNYRTLFERQLLKTSTCNRHVRASSRLRPSSASVGQRDCLRRAGYSIATNAFIPIGPPVMVNQFGISVGASYELDVWDRIGASQRAAKYDVRAAQLDLNALLMSVTAQIAETWVLLIEQRAAKKLVIDQIETNATLLQLVKVRFSHGLAQAADVLRQKQQVMATKSLLPPIDAQRKTLEHQLAILVGQAPSRSSTPVKPTTQASAHSRRVYRLTS